MNNKQPGWRQAVIQISLAMAFLWISLVILWYSASTQILWAVGAGSLASTAYIVCMRPHGITAEPKCIIGSYLVAVACGQLMQFLTESLNVASFQLTFFELTLLSIAAMVAVGTFLFLSKLLRLEHPPAAGIVLIIVLDEPDYGAVAAIVGCVIVIAIIRKLFVKRLYNLQASNKHRG